MSELQSAAEERPLVAVTAWDYYSGLLVEECGPDIVLVGDSLAMTVRGEPTTLRITLDEMLYHAKQVVRACSRALVIGDMPFMSYQVDEKQGLVSAGRFVQEAGVQAVKVEGGQETASTISKITSAGIPVLGHIGLRPQQVHRTGLKVQGRSAADAETVIADALAVEAAGCFAVVLECLPAELAAAITGLLGIPTIGIGAGSGCKGQIQVTADILGMGSGSTPRHAAKFADVRGVSREAMVKYAESVRNGSFPGASNTFPASEELLEFLRGRKA